MLNNTIQHIAIGVMQVPMFHISCPEIGKHCGVLHNNRVVLNTVSSVNKDFIARAYIGLIHPVFIISFNHESTTIAAFEI